MNNKKPDIPKAMMDNVPLINNKKDQPSGPEALSFYGIPIPEDWMEGLVMKVTVFGESHKMPSERVMYSTSPIVGEPGIFAVPQAFEVNPTGTIYEVRAFSSYGAKLITELVAPPEWWPRVMEKDFIRPNGKHATKGE